jgi:hypothetical protein
MNPDAPTPLSWGGVIITLGLIAAAGALLVATIRIRPDARRLRSSRGPR